MSTLKLIRRVLNGDDLTEEEWRAARKAIDFLRDAGELR